MLRYLFKFYLLILTGLLLINTGELSAQPAEKARERIQQVKKIKLLDVLQLDEKASEKFLSKYNYWEKQIQDKRDDLDNHYDDLESSLKRNAGKEEINQKTSEILRLRNELNNLHQEKMKAMRSVLDEIQFGKYVLFENKFMKELQSILIKQYKMNVKPDNKTNK